MDTSGTDYSSSSNGGLHPPDLVPQLLLQPPVPALATTKQPPPALRSHAQVYKATTVDGKSVAVKIQRPDAQEMVSLDLYILRNAAAAYQTLVRQTIGPADADFVSLFDEWAQQLYAELDFAQEAASQERLRGLLAAAGVCDVYVPTVYRSTRRLIVSEWIAAERLSDCTADQVQ